MQIADRVTWLKLTVIGYRNSLSLSKLVYRHTIVNSIATTCGLVTKHALQMTIDRRRQTGDAYRFSVKDYT